MCDGSPPKLHGHDTVQLQLSATVADSSDEAIESANAVNGSLDMTQTALERANAAAAGIALQVGAAEAAVTQALATLREAS